MVSNFVEITPLSLHTNAEDNKKGNENIFGKNSRMCPKDMAK